MRDLILDPFSGLTNEEFGYQCPSGSLPPNATSLWSGFFIAAHEADASPHGGFTAIGWDVFGNKCFAKKHWQIDKPDLDLVEVGTFKPYHRPGG